MVSFWDHPQLSIADFRNLWDDGGLSHQILDDVIWLAVYLPLWKIWKSDGIILPNIWKIIQMFQTTNQLDNL
jgi:hypothetical protein